jgi:hypothetical protein
MRTAHFDSAADAKRKMKSIVSLYRISHRDEYELLKKAVQFKREALADPKFAKSEQAGQSSDMRGLFEISETLQMMLVNGLTEDETVWFKTTQGGRWFAKTFGEFALPNYV